MITKLCHVIADFFIKENIIDEDQREIYKYGFELIISSIIGILIVVLIGVVSGNLLQCIIFYVVFCFTRLFCGGYHASSHLLCKLSFTAVLLMVINLNWLLKEIPNYYWFVLYLYCFIIMCCFSPIENPNKPLTYEQQKRGRRISIIEMLIWFAVICILHKFECELYHIIVLTLFFVATLMLLALFIKWRNVK